MPLLCFIFRALHLFTKLSFLNIFNFDGRKRSFERNKFRLSLTRYAHNFCIIPMLVISMIPVFFSMGRFVWHIALDSFQGNTSADAVKMLLSFIILGRTHMLIMYIVYLFKCRLTYVQQFLNDFVSAYDQCVDLFGSSLRLSWLAVGIICGKVLLLEASLWVPLFSAINLTTLPFFLIFSLQPLLFHLSCLLGLFLLHGLFRTATLNGHQYNPFWQQTLKPTETAKLIRFYWSLLALRRDFETYFRVISILEVSAGISFMITSTSVISNHLNIIYLICTGLFSLMHAIFISNYSHEIGTIADALGNELLTVEGEYVAGASSEMVELFCLNKLLMNTVYGATWRVLYLRKSFILVVVDFTIVNYFFLASILATVKT